MTLSKFVKSLFTSGNINDEEEVVWPDDFDTLDAVKLTKAIARYYEKHNERIVANFWSEAERTNALLSKLDEARPQVKGEIFDLAMAAFELSLDYGVWGGDVFTPRILPNGALVIRNHHRVISLDEQPSFELKIGAEALRAEVAKVVATFDWLEDEDEQHCPVRFFIIHRAEEHNGSVVKTLQVPEKFSSVGQTIIAFNTEVDLSASEFLANSGIVWVANHNSRCGVAFIRVFADRAYVHGSYRASDDYDVILEEYIEANLESLDEECTLTISTDYRRLGQVISERTAECVENSELRQFPEGNPMSYYVRQATSSSSYGSYSQRKLRQCMDFSPFFAAYGNNPVSYCADCPSYWELREQFGTSFAVLELRPQYLGKLSVLEKHVASFIQDLLTPIMQPTWKLKFIATTYTAYISEEEICDLDSETALAFCKAQAKPLKKEVSAAAKEAKENGEMFDRKEFETEILGNLDWSLPIVIVHEGFFDLQGFNQQILALTGEKEIDLHVHVPALGFSQGYSYGDYDTGNAPTLIVNPPPEPEEDEYEEDEENEAIEGEAIESAEEEGEAAPEAESSTTPETISFFELASQLSKKKGKKK